MKVFSNGPNLNIILDDDLKNILPLVRKEGNARLLEVLQNLQIERNRQAAELKKAKEENDRLMEENEKNARLQKEQEEGKKKLDEENNKLKGQNNELVAQLTFEQSLNNLMSDAERMALEIKMNKEQLLGILNKNREKIILARYLTFPENEREKFEDKYLNRKKTEEDFLSNNDVKGIINRINWINPAPTNVLELVNKLNDKYKIFSTSDYFYTDEQKQVARKEACEIILQLYCLNDKSKKYIYKDEKRAASLECKHYFFKERGKTLQNFTMEDLIAYCFYLDNHVVNNYNICLVDGNHNIYRFSDNNYDDNMREELEKFLNVRDSIMDFLKLCINNLSLIFEEKDKLAITDSIESCLKEIEGLKNYFEIPMILINRGFDRVTDAINAVQIPQRFYVTDYNKENRLPDNVLNK